MTEAPGSLPDTYYMNLALYISPPMAIGKHEWCCVVYRHSQYGACTDYHWRKLYRESWVQGLPRDRWRPQEEWPRYATNDTYGGLPRSLEKLYLRHRQEIEGALARGKAGAP
jgi:hypothetical protein